MSDIFGNNVTRGGVYSATDGSITIGDGPTDLVQQWQVQYTQNTRPLYQIGGNKIHYVREPPSGTMTAARIVGQGTAQLYASFSGCNTKSITIEASDGMCSGGAGGSVKLTLHDASLQSVGFSGQAGQGVVNENVSFIFTGLEVA